MFEASTEPQLSARPHHRPTTAASPPPKRQHIGRAYDRALEWCPQAEYYLCCTKAQSGSGNMKTSILGCQCFRIRMSIRGEPLLMPNLAPMLTPSGHQERCSEPCQRKDKPEDQGVGLYV